MSMKMTDRRLCALLRLAEIQIVGSTLVRSIRIAGAAAIYGFLALILMYGIYHIIQNA